MDLRSLELLNAERRARRAVMLVTDLEGGTQQVIRANDAVGDPLKEAVGEAFRSGVSKAVQSEGRSLFLNVHLPLPRLVIVGAVHISQALASMALTAGFYVEIIDPRTAFATPDRFPNVELHAQWPEEVLVARPFDRYTAVAALTHDPKIDDLPLREALDTGCFYVGALGSRKTHARRVERLIASGVSETDIGRIHAPIGLDISATSPAEIAVAVLAQIIQALRTRGVAGVQG